MKIILGILLFITCFIQTSYANRQLIDRVIAVVNEEAITQSEVDSLLRPFYEEYKSQYQGSELMMRINEIRQKLLNQLIEDRLVYQEAEDLGISVKPGEIDNEMMVFKERFPNDQAMEEAMKAQGISLGDLEERIRRQVMVRKLHDSEVRSKIVVSPLDIDKYYQKHKKDFSAEDSLLVRSITIKKSDEARRKGLTDESAKAQINEIRKQILSGQDFASLAKAHSQDTRASQGGLSEWVERGAMIAVIDQVIFRLKDGEVSEVIETPMGYHLFRVEDRKQGYQYDLEEVRDKITSQLYHEKFKERFEEWMEVLKRNAYISIR